MLTTHERNAKIKLAAIVVSVIVVAGIVVFADHLKAHKSSAASTLTPDSSSTAQSTPDPSSTAVAPSDTSGSSSSSDTTTTSGLKDGTYTASTSYFVPSGQESIQVSVTLQNGVITASSIQNSESDHDSAQFQKDFAAVYKSHVVGKKISGLQVGALAGASDTAQGFNEALNQIASKAQA